MLKKHVPQRLHHDNLPTAAPHLREDLFTPRYGTIEMNKASCTPCTHKAPPSKRCSAKWEPTATAATANSQR
jgi:hypothetical protein